LLIRQQHNGVKCLLLAISNIFQIIIAITMIILSLGRIYYLGTDVLGFKFIRYILNVSHSLYICNS